MVHSAEEACVMKVYAITLPNVSRMIRHTSQLRNMTFICVQARQQAPTTRRILLTIASHPTMWNLAYKIVNLAFREIRERTSFETPKSEKQDSPQHETRHCPKTFLFCLSGIRISKRFVVASKQKRCECPIGPAESE